MKRCLFVVITLLFGVLGPLLGAANAATTTAKCALSATSLTVGSPVSLSCSGFQGGESIKIYFDSTKGTALITTAASSSGGIKKSVIVPERVGGSHKFVAVGARSHLKPTASFQIIGSLGLSRVTGTSGSLVTATLRGFGKVESVDLRFSTSSRAACK